MLRTGSSLSVAAALICLLAFSVPPALAGDIREIGVFHVIHRSADGTILHEEDAPNNLADEGEQTFLDCVLRATSCPTTFFLRLYNDTPVETDTLSTLTGEPTTNSYAAQELTRDSTGWPTLALDSGDYQATAAAKTFQATGGSWGPVTYLVLATTSNSTGKLISYAALSTSRTLAAGESLQVTYKLKLQ
jgi:hypothetical protein